jgi:hypothetical protein
VVTPRAGDVLLRDAFADRVTVVNQADDRVVAYFLTIVPSVLVKVAILPWRRVLTDVGYAVRKSGVLQQLSKLLKPKRLP